MLLRSNEKVPSVDAMPEQAVMFEEYKAITDLHKHFDTMNLSMMSTITAGVFILWGIMLDGRAGSLPPVVLVILAMIVFFVLSTWIRYMSIHRSIVTRKLARACQIEHCCGMSQNSMFQYDNEIRRNRRRPGAHAAELAVYMLLTLLGATVMTFECLLAAARSSATGLPTLIDLICSNWYLVPVLLFQGLFAGYWSILCRVLVIEVIPHYQLPLNKVMRWLFVKVGNYRDLADETSSTAKGS